MTAAASPLPLAILIPLLPMLYASSPEQLLNAPYANEDDVAAQLVPVIVVNGVGAQGEGGVTWKQRIGHGHGDVERSGRLSVLLLLAMHAAFEKAQYGGEGVLIDANGAKRWLYLTVMLMYSSRGTSSHLGDLPSPMAPSISAWALFRVSTA
ncbi:hypothetical protein B0J12DRAFT_699431 [Macrophomina phaseolina]|uniref:Uncharacterized protein n=1 Tax=Macrophomina phaseolina TaxID=35725 RepID=A0ABQ8GA99_9PEZI|nr:hypothetical protein B0J12DRAFT_699431 [Macrophomina phaseolina]